MQSGRVLGELIAATSGAIFLAGKKSIKNVISLVPKLTPALAGKATEYFINNRVNELNKKFTSNKRSGITLANNETRDIMKIIKFLENRGILLKGTTRKITNQEGES